MQDVRKPPRRHGEAFWRRAFSVQRDSGLTQFEFCREHGLARSTFYRWQRRLGEVEEAAEGLGSPGFVEVNLKPEPPAPERPGEEEGFELRFASGVRLRLPSQVQGQSLAEVLGALQARGLC